MTCRSAISPDFRHRHLTTLPEVDLGTVTKKCLRKLFYERYRAGNLLLHCAAAIPFVLQKCGCNATWNMDASTNSDEGSRKL